MDDVFHPSVELARGDFYAEIWAASVYLYRDLDLGVTTSEGSARYSLPVSGKTSLDLGAHFGLIDGDDFGKYLYYGVDVVVPIQLKENAIFHYDDSDEGSPTPDSYFHGSTSITIGF